MKAQLPLNDGKAYTKNAAGKLQGGCPVVRKALEKDVTLQNLQKHPLWKSNDRNCLKNMVDHIKELAK